MKKLLSFIAVFFLICGAAMAGQQPSQDGSTHKRLNVIASFSVLGDMVAQIGGENVTVKTLVGADGDAHTYQPTPDDIRAISHADIVFMNGLGFEGWIDRLIQSSETKAKLIIASKGVVARTMMDEHDGKSEKVTDPHAWQDLGNAHIYIKNILAALIEADPAQESVFRSRAAAFDAEVTALDNSVRQQINAVPLEKRNIITSHDAFGYFGAGYNVSFMAAEGVSTEAQPSAADIAKLIDQIKAQKVKRVFIENMTDSRLIEQIAKDSGAVMGGTLFSDALSPATGPAPRYLDMFRNNVPKLVEAMQLNGK
jgi:zinc/manganese transport system substrate-binding protein